MMKRRKTIALLTALTLLLVLAAGCGSRETEQDASGPIPAENQPSPAVQPEAGPPESETPEEEAPEEEAPAAVPADSQPEETDSESEPEPAPEPEPPAPPEPLQYQITDGVLDRWVYSPPNYEKPPVETVFRTEEPPEDGEAREASP